MSHTIVIITDENNLTHGQEFICHGYPPDKLGMIKGVCKDLRALLTHFESQISGQSINPIVTTNAMPAPLPPEPSEDTKEEKKRRRDYLLEELHKLKDIDSE